MATAAKRTTSKVTTKKNEVAVDSVTETVETPKKSTRKFEANELIECRSITQGLLLMPGKQSNILYRWEGYGDVREIEYRDLYSLKSSRSPYVYEPLFVIEDEELLEDPRWKDIKELYDTLYDSIDINTVLKLSPAQFKKALTEAPTGFRNAIKIEVATRLDNGTFDSIQKLRVVDELCGTELEKMI